MKIKIMEGKVLAKLIGSIGEARVKLDEQVQVACLQVIAQSVLHRNTSPANSLLDAVSKHHKATVVAYLEKFGNFAWDKKAEKASFREVHKVDELEKAIDAIGEAKWYDARKPTKAVSQYDMLTMCSDFFERAFKAAKKEGVTVVNKPVLDAAYAAYCEAVSKAYGEGDKSLEQQAVDTALDARSKGLATPAQLKMLSDHYGKPVTQHAETPSAKADAAVQEAHEINQFGGAPALAAQ